MLAKSISVKKKTALSKQSSKNSMDLLLEYCKDIHEWPDKWEIDNADLKAGKAILAEFKPFLIGRIKKGQAKKPSKDMLIICGLWGAS